MSGVYVLTRCRRLTPRKLKMAEVPYIMRVHNYGGCNYHGILLHSVSLTERAPHPGHLFPLRRCRANQAAWILHSRSRVVNFALAKRVQADVLLVVLHPDRDADDWDYTCVYSKRSYPELEKSAAIRHHCALSPSIMAPFCGHGCPWRITVTDAHERVTDRSFKVARNEYFCD